jgi:transcriptional regulator with XRE-family HTH domain
MIKTPWNKNKSVGRQIKEARLKAGLSIYKLAKLSDVSRSYIHCLESGKRKNPTIETLNKIFDVLNKSVDS